MEKKIEALEEKLKTVEGEERVDVLIKLNSLHISSMPEKARQFIEQACTLAETLGYEQGIGNAYQSWGYYYLNTGDYQQALSYFEKSLQINEKINHRNRIIYDYNGIGTIYEMQGNFNQAIEYYFRMLHLAEEAHDEVMIANSYTNIGNAFFNQQKDFEEALQYYQQAFEIYEKHDQKEPMARIFNNFGLIYHYRNKDYQQALQYYQNALNIFEEVDHQRHVANVYCNLGILYAEQEKFEQALPHSLKALEKRKTLNDLHGLAGDYNNIGAVYLGLEKYELAEEYFKKGLELSQEIGAKGWQRVSCFELALLYEKIENYQQAYQYQARATTLEREIFDEEKSKQITEMQTKYETEKKEKEAEIYRLKNIELVEKNDLILKQKEELEIHREELRMQNEQLSETLNELQRTQEQLIESRKMAALGELVAGVAHEINTPVGVMITAVSAAQNKTQNLAHLYENEEITSDDFEAYLQHNFNVNELVMKNLNRTDRLIQTFKQVAIDPTLDEKRIFCLYSYFDGVFKNMDARLNEKQISVHLNCPSELELNSYPQVFTQIINFLVDNSLIHGFNCRETGEITIDAISEENQLRIRYQDDGVGIDDELLPRIFDPFVTSNKQKGAGLGLHIVYNLVTRVLQGSIQYQQAEKGVIFEIIIPS